MPSPTFLGGMAGRFRRLRPPGGGFLPADAASLALAAYLAAHLWHPLAFPPRVWVWVGAAWLLAWAAAAGLPDAPGPGGARRGWLPPLVAGAAGGTALKVAVLALSGRQAAAFAVLAMVLAALARLGAGIIRAGRGGGPGEGLRLAAAQGAALFAVHPYLRSALVGAGDASSYSLMVADFRAQWHAGVFPVLIGQSRFAFNGGFQPIRNAPCLEYLSGLIDVLTLGTMNEFALLNLTVLASMLGAILGGYAALRILIPRVPWGALGLAVLFGLSPGVLAPLYGGDMFPTFLTLPFLPWLFLGLAESGVQPARLWPWALQAAALAAMWLSHPPVAAWATLVAAVAGAWTLIRERRWRVVRQQAIAGALFLALAGFLFVSVSALELPAVSRSDALASIGYKLEVLQENWRSSFVPVSARGDRLLGDLQLGYGLWLCLALSVPLALRRPEGRKLLGCFALLLVFTWPVPLVTGWAWRHLPTELLVVTNQWPVERFYILLAGLAVFVASVAIRAAPAPLLGRRWAAGGVLVVALAWSAAEARKFFVRGADAALTEAQSEDLHRPEGIIVSRTHSNEYLGTPPYFSYGHMDPRLEIRLLDPQTREVRADGATLRPHLEGTPPPVRVLDLTETTAGTLADPLTLAAGSAVILRFDFEGSHPDGELQFLGEHLHDSYVLPQSGLSKAFGSEPGNARALVLENSTAAPEHVSLVFLRRSGNRPGVRFGRVSVEPLAESTRAVRLDSLVPLHVHVSAGAGGYLESPRLFVPGYRAIVDGRPAPVWKSSSGLVAVHLDRGEHDVILAYPGGRLLRWTFFGTAFAWLVAIGAVGNQEFINRSIAPAVRAARRNLLGRIRDRGRPGWAAWFPPALGVVALAAFLAWYGPSAPAAPAGYRLVLRLPFVVPGATEPLLTSGRPGAGDFIYVTYIDGTHLVVGHDKWNFGGARSRPFVVDPERDQTLEVDLGGGTPAGARGPVRPVTVRWNGTLLFTDPLGSYPAKPGEVTVGTNLIGGSTTSSRFSGEILATEPLPAR